MLFLLTRIKIIGLLPSKLTHNIYVPVVYGAYIQKSLQKNKRVYTNVKATLIQTLYFIVKMLSVVVFSSIMCVLCVHA